MAFGGNLMHPLIYLEQAKRRRARTIAERNRSIAKRRKRYRSTPVGTCHRCLVICALRKDGDPRKHDCPHALECDWRGCDRCRIDQIVAAHKRPTIVPTAAGLVIEAPAVACVDSLTLGVGVEEVLEVALLPGARTTNPEWTVALPIAVCIRCREWQYPSLSGEITACRCWRRNALAPDFTE